MCVRECVCACVCVTMKRQRQAKGRHDKRYWYFSLQCAYHCLQVVSSSKHNAKKCTTTARRLSHQSVTAILTEEKEKQFAKPTNVSLLVWDLNKCVCVCACVCVCLYADCNGILRTLSFAGRYKFEAAIYLGFEAWCRLNCKICLGLSMSTLI